MANPDLLAAHARRRPYTQRLHLGPPPADVIAIPCISYQNEELLREEIGAYAARLRSDDLRAAASVWSKHYVAAIVPGVIALMTLEGIGVEASASSVRIQQHEGRPHAAWIPDALLAIHAERASVPPSAEVKPIATTAELHAWVLPSLVERHLAPLFETLERAVGLWRGVAWSNAGNSLAWYFDQFEPLAPVATREDRTAFLGDPASPMHDPVEYVDLAPHGLERRVQVRHTCCLRHRLPDTTECYTCPRLSDPARAALLRTLEAHK